MQRNRRVARLCAATAATLSVIALTPAMASAGAMITDVNCSANALPRGADATTSFNLTNPLNFAGSNITKVYVNDNGNVTLDDNMFGVNPKPQLKFAGRKIVAPFFADVDTRHASSNQVTFGNDAAFDGRKAFCANWNGVGYFDQGTVLNRFQLLLVDRSNIAPGDFDIVFNYDEVKWETGDQHGGNVGTGGDSARAGFTDGFNAQELTGSGSNAALLDGNTLTGLVHNSLNSPVLGRYVFEVRSSVAPTGHQISGAVLNSTGGTPVPNANVWACRTTGGPCATNTSGTAGAYALNGLPDGDYTVAVSAPGMLTTPASTVTVSGADVTHNLYVHIPVGPPAGTTVVGSTPGPGGVPSVDPTQPLTFTSKACAGATVNYTVTFANGTVLPGVMTPGAAGDFTATIFPPFPLGAAQFSLQVTGCGPTTAVAFDVYIDPSGNVLDTNGAPIDGATAILLRSNTRGGPFLRVANGSTVMSPSNRNNPDLTQANGHFGWDVIAGYYKVRAERAGCHAPGDPAKSFVETRELKIPPPVTNLVLVLECPGQTPGQAGGSVPSALSLKFAGPAEFGVFTPGIAKDYQASVAANVISTAGNALLSVADASSTATGHLVNGAFSLPSRLEAKASSPAGTGSAFASVGGSTSPTSLLTYQLPVSNDPVGVTLLQRIGAGDALRTGRYSKALTFTLSTTAP